MHVPDPTVYFSSRIREKIYLELYLYSFYLKIYLKTKKENLRCME